MTQTAREVRARLEDLATPSELTTVRKRLAADEPAIGVRMKDLFDTAKSATDMALGEVERLLDDPAYEPRMAAFCILDFKARIAMGSAELCEIYLRRHDRITTWDMVDRSAPRVVGGAVAGGPYEVLHELAAAAEPLRRRSAITAPLYFTRRGDAADLAAGFAVARVLHADPEPSVSNAVGIFLAHAGDRDQPALRAFLDEHGLRMPRAAARLATRKLSSKMR